MSNHPAYGGDPSCCSPFKRITPSGRVQRWHAFGCPVSPNDFIPREPYRPEPVVLHDYNSCGIRECLTCSYYAAHLDSDDDIRNGGWA